MILLGDSPSLLGAPILMIYNQYFPKAMAIIRFERNEGAIRVVSEVCAAWHRTKNSLDNDEWKQREIGCILRILDTFFCWDRY